MLLGARSNEIEILSAAGVATPERHHVHLQQDGASVSLWVDGVDVTDTINVTGSGITAASWLADLVSNSGVTGAGDYFSVTNDNNSRTPNNIEAMCIVSAPYVFYNSFLSGAQIASIFASAGYGSGHDDYLEYMIELMSPNGFYYPGLPVSLNSGTIPSAAMVPNTTTTNIGATQSNFGTREDPDTVFFTAYNKVQTRAGASTFDSY